MGTFLSQDGRCQFSRTRVASSLISKTREQSETMLVDPTMLMLLNGAVPGPVATGRGPTMMNAAALNLQGDVPGTQLAQQQYALHEQQVRFNAMLMSPIPVLAQLVKKNLADSATAAVQGATALADFAAQQTAGAFDPAGDVPMLDDIPDIEDAAAASGDGGTISGSTAMVGAAAAALALMNIRAQQR